MLTCGGKDFVLSQISLTMEVNLGWKLFMTFATINIGGMFVFTFFIPETKGRSLEEMDVIFGAVSKEQREADIQRAGRGKQCNRRTIDRYLSCATALDGPAVESKGYARQTSSSAEEKLTQPVHNEV